MAAFCYVCPSLSVILLTDRLTGAFEISPGFSWARGFSLMREVFEEHAGPRQRKMAL